MMADMSTTKGTVALAIDPAAARSQDSASLPTEVVRTSDLALSLLAVTPDCVKLLDLDGTLTFMNHGGRCVMEIDDLCAVLGQKWWALWPASERDRLMQAVADAAVGHAVEFVAACPTAKGNPRWWAVRVSPVLGQQGQASQILAVSRDVTDLMQRQDQLERALKESDMLRREVDHRLKNSLGLVSSMLNLKARSAVDAQVADALRDAAMRVRTIASVHDRLYRANDDMVGLDDYIASLIDDIQVSLGGAVRLTYDGLQDGATVASDVSLALGLIVAELTGNALRHADLTQGDMITVALTRLDDGRLQLSVQDTGCGLPADFSLDRASMGMTIIASMAQKIGATLDWRRDLAKGTCFVVTCIGGH